MNQKLLNSLNLKLLMLAILFFLFFPIFGQDITVSGIVTDEEGLPLVGASVLLEGTTSGAITDVDGKYLLNNVSENGVLKFSFIGYSTTEISINGNNTINATLAIDNEALQEIVVVGYGEQRRESVTGSVVSIDGDNLREVPSTNVTQALQGRLPGVQITQVNSEPGADMQIRIRGVRSLTADNNPLIVLDGIPFGGSITDINPNDVKSIDVLKDASATAIYGSRGANGVIIITTNRGSEGQGPQVSLNNFIGVKNVFGRYPMMTGEELADLRLAAGLYLLNPGEIQLGADEAIGNNTDWQDEIYRAGLFNNNNLSVTGSTNGGNYNFGLGYIFDEAIIPQDYKRYSLRGSLDQKIGEIFKVGITTNNNFSINNGRNLGIYGALSSSPLASPYDGDGNLKRTIVMPLDENWVYTEKSLENLNDRWIDRGRSFGSYNNLFGEIEVPGIEGLKYRLNLGLNVRESEGGAYTGEGVFTASADTPSSASISNSRNTQWVVENLLFYDKNLNEKHEINITALYSNEDNNWNSSFIQARDIPSDAFQFYNLGRAAGEITINPDWQGYGERGIRSYMGRVMYGFEDRYFVSATLRSDGSSVLAPGNKWHTYPAVSVGWNLSNEDFMQDGFFDLLKLRTGYGETSNQAVDPYKTRGLLATRPYNFGENFDVGYYVTELPNPNLGWEFSETWNLGVDFDILNNRLMGTAEYYVTNTNDLLLSESITSATGGGSILTNAGETQNKGFELSLNGAIIQNLNGWSLDAGINFFTNKNEIVALSSGRERDEGNGWFVGESINSIFDYEYAGIWQEGDPYLEILEPDGQVGMVKVVYAGEYNTDGTPVRRIGPDDRQIINLDPDFEGGFNTRLAYKNIDLNMVAVFRGGGKIISTLYTGGGYLNLMNGRRGNVKVDYWSPENTDARFPNPAGPRSGDNPRYSSTLGLFDGGYLKMRTISLGYNFDDSLLGNLGIKNLRTYVTAQNPFVLFSPYFDESGMDPETNSYGDENQAVSSYNRRILTIGTNTPSTRNFLFGLNLTF